MAYHARDLLAALASARACARKTQTPYHLIDQNGELHAVRTVAPSDKVVVRDIIAARHTRAMIEASSEASQELHKAMPYITRAIEIVQGAHPDLDHDEVFADLLHTAEIWCENKRPTGAKRSWFARMFGLATY